MPDMLLGTFHYKQNQFSSSREPVTKKCTSIIYTYSRLIFSGCGNFLTMK